MDSQGVLWEGTPTAGPGLSPSSQNRAQGSLAQTQHMLIGLWSHWILSRASSPPAGAGNVPQSAPQMHLGVLRAPAPLPWPHRRHLWTPGEISPCVLPQSHNRNCTEHFFLTWTVLLIPGWNKTKIYSYSFYDIHQRPLSLGKRLEEHSEMQCAVSHTNSSWYSCKNYSSEVPEKILE